MLVPCFANCLICFVISSASQEEPQKIWKKRNFYDRKASPFNINENDTRRPHLSLRKWPKAITEPSCPRMTFKSQLWGALETCRVAKCCKNDSDGLRLGCFGHIHSRPWDKNQSDGSPLGCFGHVRWRPWDHLDHFRAQNQEEPKKRIKKTELLWPKSLSI